MNKLIPGDRPPGKKHLTLMTSYLKLLKTDHEWSKTTRGHEITEFKFLVKLPQVQWEAISALGRPETRDSLTTVLTDEQSYDWLELCLAVEVDYDL